MKFVINVIPRTKKNSQNIVLVNNRPIIVPSKQYKQFEKECKMTIPVIYKQKINRPVNIKAVFYTETRRKIDLTNLLEALDDALIAANIIEDDNRNIIAGHDGSRVYYDKDNPRIEVEITKMEGYETWIKKK